MRKIFKYILIFILTINIFSITCYTNAEDKIPKNNSCKWIKLNTDFPIIGDCIWVDGGVNATNAFPTMIWALIKIITSIIIIVCFIMIIVAGIEISSGNPKDGKAKIVKVAWTIALLWLSWVILRLINPTFFG